MSLVQQIRAHRPDAWAAVDERALAALEAQLQAGLAAARAELSGVELDDGAFAEQLARHLPEPSELAALRFADLGLAGACLRGSRAALAALDARVLSRVPRWLARMAGVNADDVQQELRSKLLLGPAPLLERYTGRRPLEAWIRVAAHRRAISQKLQHKPSDHDALESIWSGPDPELDLVKLRDREAMRAVLHEVLSALPARDKSLLRLHYVDGMSLERLAVFEGVHRATVARHLAAARAAVVERVRALLRERLRLSTEDGDSLLRFVRSRLELSLRRVLDRTPAE